MDRTTRKTTDGGPALVSAMAGYARGASVLRRGTAAATERHARARLGRAEQTRTSDSRPEPGHALAPRFQRAVDIAVAISALILLLPVLIVIAIVIKIDTRGPILYRQLRIGLDRRLPRDRGRSASRRTANLGGRPFTLLKFRTMRVDAERETGPVWAAPEDERVTRVGRFLRHYRLDEIPQFWNVLRGDMAIVGPRPERPAFVRALSDELDGYLIRHRVRPGITGWAQVNQKPDQTLDDVRRKLTYDLEYLERRSIAFDLRIMMQTIPVMLDRLRSRDTTEVS